MDFKRVKRVLIYRLGSLGDTVVALPALHLVERSFPASRRLLMTNIRVHSKAPAAFSVLNGSGLVHDVIDYPLATRNLLKLAQIWWRLVRFRPQVVIYLMAKRSERSLERDERFFRLCGARHVIGLPIGDLAESLHDSTTDTWEYEAARLLRCLRALGEISIDDLANWDLRLTPGEKQKAHAVLTQFEGRPFIACGPGTKMQAKDWGQENWRQLLTRLSAEIPNHGLVLVGAQEDAAVSDYAGKEWRGPVANLCGQLSPRETAAVLKHAELFLGPDSGPMHLAAAYGIPCAIAFASIDRPGRWFPFGQIHRAIYNRVDCANCRLTVCIEQRKKCILSITVDQMLAAGLALISAGKSAIHS
ncbi:MAG TPA: glycosyltransferase family 9 protein [Acidobacteriaceae bacterium]|jgi:ADP-heptose:LPS heptosyltransferase